MESLILRQLVSETIIDDSLHLSINRLHHIAISKVGEGWRDKVENLLNFAGEFKISSAKRISFAYRALHFA